MTARSLPWWTRRSRRWRRRSCPPVAPRPQPLPPEPQPPPEPRPKTVLLIVHAPGGRCWDATIAGRPVRDGCGSVEFSLEVEGFVLVHFERGQYGEGQITALIEAAGRIVQTVGPTTDQYPSFNIGCRVPGSE